MAGSVVAVLFRGRELVLVERRNMLGWIVMQWYPRVDPLVRRCWDAAFTDALNGATAVPASRLAGLFS